LVLAIDAPDCVLAERLTTISLLIEVAVQARAPHCLLLLWVHGRYSSVNTICHTLRLLDKISLPGFDHLFLMHNVIIKRPLGDLRVLEHSP
jgi:hypothetical protein